MNQQAPKVLNSANSRLYVRLYDQAFRMRNNPTRVEAILWDALKEKQLGYKFRRQHIIDRFIVDFYCIEKGLVIELDGGIHAHQRDRDLERSQILEDLGCHILRFDNIEIIDNLSQVLNTINKHLKQ